MTPTIAELREKLAKAEWTKGWGHNIVPPGKPAHELACAAVRALPALLDRIEKLEAGPARWRSIEVDGPPEPEVFVLCWNGRETFVDWFGSKPDAGRGVTHWLPYEMPPGCTSDMHDGSRTLLTKDSTKETDDAD